MTFAYDRQERELTSTDAAGTITRDFDMNGNVIRVCDARSNCVRSDFNSANEIIATWAETFSGGADAQLSATTYDPAGRVLSQTDALGTVISYGYDDADRQTTATLVDIDGTTRDVRLTETVYDDRGLPITLTQGGTAGQAAMRTTTTVFNLGGLADSVTINRAAGNHITEMTYTAAAQTKTVTTRIAGVSADSSTTAYVYVDGLVSTETSTLAGGPNPVTTYFYDGFGRLDSSVTANGDTWNYGIDAAGQTVSVTAPPAQDHATGPLVTVTSFSGYDAFGNVTESRTARGYVTSYGYDNVNRQTSITHPTYTTPAGATINAVETFIYDPNGNLQTQTTRRGYTIDYTYDDLNRALTRKNERNKTESFQYDLNGNLTQTKTALNAVTNYLYNDFNQLDTTTNVVRAVTLPYSGQTRPAATFTTIYGYDDLANHTATTTPAGLTTSYDYDTVNNLTSITDPDNKVTTFTHNQLGQVKDATDRENRTSRTVYDTLGRTTQTLVEGTNSTTSRQVTYTFDANSNTLSMADTEGGLSAYQYDSRDRITNATVLLSATPLVQATTTYGYNKTSQLTRITDPNGNQTTNTYNFWDLIETTVEPATTAHPNTADRTFTSTYDADGQLVLFEEPGNIWVATTRNEIGQITREKGGDNRYRSFSYNVDNTTKWAWSPGGVVRFAYDDRGLLLESKNLMATTTFEHDADARLTERIELVDTVTRTHNFTWTTQNELLTHTDPTTGLTATHTYNNASQITRTDWTSGAYRTRTYTVYGDIYQDRWRRASGSIRARTDHFYDSRGDVTRARMYYYGTGGTKDHHYDYNEGGQLTNWTVTNTAGTVTYDDTTYTYDPAGNRLTKTTNGTVATFTYNQRNQILTGPSTTYVWKARGVLDRQTANGALTRFYYESLGRQRLVIMPDGTRRYYYYDSYDRLAYRYIWNTTDWQRFAYPGKQQGTIGSYGDIETIAYGRTPGGTLTGLIDPTGNQRGAVTNQHGDLVALTPLAGTNPTKTVIYDPYGDIYAQWGSDPDPELGYQTQYTDPTTGDVLMQSRWYNAGTATFRSRDTYAGNLNTPVSLNRYTYAGNNPIRYSDPTGRCVNIVFDHCVDRVAQTGNIGGLDDLGTRRLSPTTKNPQTLAKRPGVQLASFGVDSGATEFSSVSASTEAAYISAWNNIDTTDVSWNLVGAKLNQLQVDDFYDNGDTESQLALSLFNEARRTGLIVTDELSAGQRSLRSSQCADGFCSPAFDPISKDLIGYDPDLLGHAIAAEIFGRARPWPTSGVIAPAPLDAMSGSGSPVVDLSRPGVTRIGTDRVSVHVGQNAPLNPAQHNVVVHGSRNGLTGSLTQVELNAIVIPRVPVGCTIVFLSCHSGASGTGQALANATGRNVWAPTTRVGIVKPHLGPPFPLVVEPPGIWVYLRPAGGN